MIGKCLKCRNSQVKSFSCPKPSWSSQTNYRLTKGAGSLTVIHLCNLGYEHLQNTWSSWWNCMAWSKSALLLELSWLAYSLLYFAPLAKSLGDKKVPDNGNTAQVFDKDTTEQGHECLKTNVQTSVLPSHHLVNIYITHGSWRPVKLKKIPIIFFN